MMSPHAYIIHGQVMHERLRPKWHRFVYPVFYVRLNLAHLDQCNSAWFGVNRRRIASVNTRDYGARDGGDLSVWMRGILRGAGIEAEGEIWLQTFPRLFGFVFNPVSFWYCYDQAGTLQAVLAEVNNTFGESHRYLLYTGEPITAETSLTSQKNMHVSPFCEVKGGYQFQFRETASTTLVRLDYSDADGVVIKTAVGGTIAELNSARVLRAVLRRPWLTIGVVAAIHWQAFKLWRKGVPWFSKPEPPTALLTKSPQQQQEPIS